MCDNEELLKEGYTKFTLSHMGKLRRFFLHWKHGREDQFPICCILRFSIEMALSDGKTFPLGYPWGANKRGVATTKRAGETFVPCGIFHHGKKCNKN